MSHLTDEEFLRQIENSDDPVIQECHRRLRDAMDNAMDALDAVECLIDERAELQAKLDAHN